MTFAVILHTDRQTDRQTNYSDQINSALVHLHLGASTPGIELKVSYKVTIDSEQMELRRVRRSLDVESVKTRVHAFVTTRASITVTLY